MLDKNRIIDRCEQVVESIDLILHWSEAINTPEEFLLSPDSVLVFDGCVMRLQIIGESIKKIDDQTKSSSFEIECLANYHKPSINHYFCGITY